MERDGGSPGPGYYQRKDVSPRPGNEPERWPHIEDDRLFRQNVSETAKALGLEGIAKKYLFGKGGDLETLVRARSERRVAQQRRLDVERAIQCSKLISTAEGRATAAMERSKLLDARARTVRERLAAARRRREQIEADLAALTQSERGGRHEGKEAAVAAGGVAVMDAATFVLVIDAVGGEEWVRYTIAIALVLTYTVAVVVAGKTLAGAWRRLSRRKSVAVTLGVGALVALGVLATATFISLGEFRAEAIVSIDRNTAANPSFLLYGQATAALAAALSFGFLNLSSTGARLRDEIAAVDTQARRLDADASSLEREAAAAATDAESIVRAAEEAKAESRYREESLIACIAEEQAKGDETLRAAGAAHREGWAVWEQQQNSIRPPEDHLTVAQRKSIVQRLARLRAEGDLPADTNGGGFGS